MLFFQIAYDLHLEVFGEAKGNGIGVKWTTGPLAEGPLSDILRSEGSFEEDPRSVKILRFREL
jgi:hypothetical protein